MNVVWPDFVRLGRLLFVTAVGYEYFVFYFSLLSHLFFQTAATATNLSSTTLSLICQQLVGCAQFFLSLLENMYTKCSVLGQRERALRNVISF